jgi:hypothetical protein
MKKEAGAFHVQKEWSAWVDRTSALAILQPSPQAIAPDAANALPAAM